MSTVAVCPAKAAVLKSYLFVLQFAQVFAGLNEWNKLSTDCVTASSVNMFKNKVDTYPRRAGYK